MPRYDYKCDANGHIFEVKQAFTDDPIAFCPEDGSKGVRQFTVPHVIYKGSGFYTTDYGRSSKSNGSGGRDKAESSESSEKSGSSDKSSSSEKKASSDKKESKSESK